MDYTALSDHDLLQHIGTRDQRALAALYQRYGTPVYSVAMRVLRNGVWAEEAAQDTFLKVWNKPDSWNAEVGAFSSWLLTVARYTAIDRLRKEVRHQPALELEETHASLVDLPDEGGQLGGLIAQLPPEQARLIELASYQGMTHQELADSLNIPLGTIKTRLRLGLQKLRALWMETQNS
jgi:RNA polymerase sigma-70 factor, ECF subfamily